MSELANWSGFFSAVSGAIATLIGFVFVAVSINLTRILGTPGLPGRAGEAVVALAAMLIVTLLGLVPAQGLRVFGIETLIIAFALGCFGVGLQLGALRRGHYRQPHHMAIRVVLAQSALAPLIVAGVLLALGRPYGLYWLVPSVAITIVASVLNAWVLLVEILR
jgi:modulator of FtsH protease